MEIEDLVPSPARPLRLRGGACGETCLRGWPDGQASDCLLDLDNESRARTRDQI